jgi:uncharacterized membrane protein
MWLYYAAIILTIVTNVFYHIIQKLTPTTIDPIASLIVTYLVAAAFCLIILPFYPHSESLVSSFKKANWTSFALGISIVGLELGFLLAYRAGWNLSLANICSNTTVALLLIPIGKLFFNERINAVNIIGIILCFGGLILINHK